MTNFMQVSEAILRNNFKENILRISAEINAEKEKDSTYEDFQHVEFIPDIYEDSKYIIHYGHRSIKRKLLPHGEEVFIEIGIRFVFTNENEPIIDYSDIRDNLMSILSHYHKATTPLKNS